jgi:hypothetical protein
MNRITATSLASAVLLGTFVAGCKPTQNPEPKERVGPSAVTAPADYVHASFQAGEKAKATLGLMTLNKAVSMYRMQNGTNPSSLEQLRDEGLIPDIPPAPNGQKYQYDPQTGQVTVVAK